MKLGDEPIFFKLSFTPCKAKKLLEGWSYKKKKKMKIIDETV